MKSKNKTNNNQKAMVNVDNKSFLQICGMPSWRGNYSNCMILYHVSEIYKT